MNYEKNIKEARTIEAMKNGYMGVGGKFTQISKYLGEPIIKQGGIYSESTTYETFDFEEDNIKTMDENEQTYQIGWQFDGLSRGINLSIIIINHLSEISVYYEGYIVYKEVSGELESYVPTPNWEDSIKKLFEEMQKKQKIQNARSINAKNQNIKNQKNNILQKMREKWGI